MLSPRKAIVSGIPGAVAACDHATSRRHAASRIMGTSYGPRPGCWVQWLEVLFNSIQFLIFFAVARPSYFLLPYRWRWALLLAASCWFYMTFIPAYILILLVTISIDYVAG